MEMARASSAGRDKGWWGAVRVPVRVPVRVRVRGGTEAEKERERHGETWSEYSSVFFVHCIKVAVDHELLMREPPKKILSGCMHMCFWHLRSPPNLPPPTWFYFNFKF